MGKTSKPGRTSRPDEERLTNEGSALPRCSRAGQIRIESLLVVGVYDDGDRLIGSGKEIGSYMEKRTYDEKQAGAVNLSWLCCRREVYATDPKGGCIACR